MVTGMSSGTFGGTRVRRYSNTTETTPTTDPLPKDEAEQVRPERGTLARVNRQEKGDIHTKDQHTWADNADEASTAAQGAAEKRKAIAREITAAAKRVVSSHGSVKLAATLQVLKRELARCHDVLDGVASEQDYLSIVVLAELSLSETDWKKLSKAQLSLIKDAVMIGESQARVTYDDYNKVFRQLNAQGSLSEPVFDVADCNPAVDE